MIPTEEPAFQPGATPSNASAPSPQMTAQTPPQPRAPGHAPAFGGASGAAWVVRDLASI